MLLVVQETLPNVVIQVAEFGVATLTYLVLSKREQALCRISDFTGFFHCEDKVCHYFVGFLNFSGEFSGSLYLGCGCQVVDLVEDLIIAFVAQTLLDQWVIHSAQSVCIATCKVSTLDLG